MGAATIQPDLRSPERKRADEAIAFEYEQYLLMDSTTRWSITGIDDIRKLLVEHRGQETNNALPAGQIGVPLVWDGKGYEIVRACFKNGKAEAEVSPRDAGLEEELRDRIRRNPHHMLTFFQGFGYVCFVEDHTRYQDFLTCHG